MEGPAGEPWRTHGGTHLLMETIEQQTNPPGSRAPAAVALADQAPAAVAPDMRIYIYIYIFIYIYVYVTIYRNMYYIYIYIERERLFIVGVLFLSICLYFLFIHIHSFMYIYIHNIYICGAEKRLLNCLLQPMGYIRRQPFTVDYR